MKIQNYVFEKAKPVWEKDKELSYNYTLDFVTKIPRPAQKTRIALAVSSSYVLLVNGNFVSHGPARAPHGYYRVDEIDLDAFLTEEENIVAIRAAGYNNNSFMYIEMPSFLRAEITSGNDVIAYTSPDCGGFKAYFLSDRFVKVPRFSYQRGFSEHYNLPAVSFAPEKGLGKDPVTLIQTEDKNCILREVPYSEFTRHHAQKVLRNGKVGYSDKEKYFVPCVRSEENAHIHGFTIDELDYTPHITIGKVDILTREESASEPNCIKLMKDSYADIDMGKNYTGLFEFEFEAEEPGELLIFFDEVMHGDDIYGFRCGSANILGILFEAGKHKFVSAEPYTYKYARVIAKDASVTLKNYCTIRYAFPDSLIVKKFDTEKCPDPDLLEIYEAALETFTSNTMDVFMDCPGRERGGWLCDSFFTSRVEHALTGKSRVERTFLSNFLYPVKFKNIPEGMLPMCYPGDQTDGLFIPNWAMWYAIELSEYRLRSGDESLVADAKDRLYALLGYFRKFENEFALLERLENWVFIEWSRANDFVQEVSFATNMLYAAFKSALADMYQDEALAAEADALRATIRSMAMTESGFFCDNANRVNGVLTLTGERTEACQYYAFFSRTATPEEYPELWNTLLNDFGHDRKQTGKYPEIYEANAFIGNYLRLDLLEKYGYHDKLRESIKDYFSYMAKSTGTLWEHTADTASCNHGFASHVAYWLDKIGLLTEK